MNWYTIFAIVALLICVIGCLFHLIRLIKLGKPKDFSKTAGDLSKAITYSFTGAMHPSHKESAYLHLPEYSAGILFHIGAFVSILLFLVQLIGFPIPWPWLVWVLTAGLTVTSVCGLIILTTRFFHKVQKEISNPDDYISNILVTGMQCLTIGMLHFEIPILYFLWSGLLFIYLPFGKLKHVVYFFAARYHLGFFYGWRGTWPPKNN
ncbi:MAG TPA: hypothetical protein PLI77_00170 [Bacteroidales bacterium]|nr:hypothetical protein [Bacteroidales bacterium]